MGFDKQTSYKYKRYYKNKKTKKDEALKSLRNLYNKRYKKINDNIISEWKIVADLIKSI